MTNTVAGKLFRAFTTLAIVVAVVWWAFSVLTNLVPATPWLQILAAWTLAAVVIFLISLAE